MSLPGAGTVTRGTLIHTAARLLTLQGSWNTRTFIGNGFAWALTPLLRRLAGGDEELLGAMLARHAEHFNAHPYLVGVAVGAVARAEEDGIDPDRIRRFKSVLRGPLGALGDSFIWAGVLPALLLVVLELGVLGVPPLVLLIFFLVGYNAVHLVLRVWALRLGWRHALGSGKVLAISGLKQITALARRGGAFAGGTLAGSAAAWLLVDGDSAALWSPALAASLWAGYRFGLSAWRASVLGISVLTLLLVVLR